jgi:hypothetical protein
MPEGISKNITKSDDMDINNPCIESRINDKTVISTKNVIPAGRQVNRKDVDKFVEMLKEKKEKKILEDK